MASVSELHYDFRIKMDRVDTLSQQDFNDAEVDWLLNEAQMVFVNRRFSYNSNPKQTGFENSQKRIDDLSTLVVKYPTQPPILTTMVSPGVYEADLSETVYPYLHLLNAFVDLSISEGCTFSGVPLRFVQHDDLRESLKDPFESSSYDAVLYNLGRSSSGTSTSIYIYGGNLPLSSISSVYVEYLKVPSRISLGTYTYIDGNTYPAATSELPNSVHSELVDIACELAALNIENPEYIQLKTQKTLTHE